MDAINDEIASTPTRRKKPVTVENQAKLTDIYKTCIKLGTQNKINQKNAWNLTLVDRIQEIDIEKNNEQVKPSTKVNKSKMSSHMYDFKLASNTLDASVKIYAYRVDSVHASAYKVLGGLTRNDGKENEEMGEKNEEEEIDKENNNGEEKEENENEEEEVNGERKEGSKQHTKKRQKIHKSLLSGTLETNLAKINIKKIELETVVDPLFHKTSTTFDKGGAQGLLLNQLGVSEGCNVVFDSAHYQISEIDTEAVEYYDEKLFETLFDSHWQTFEICPTFVDFSFSNWQLNESITQIALNDSKKRSKNDDLKLDDRDFDRDFDIDRDDDNDNDFDHFDGIQIEPVYRDLVTNIISDNNINNINNNGDQIAFGDFDIGKVIAADNGEYSYFNKQLADSWKGPDHWKFNSKQGRSQGGEASQGGKASENATGKAKNKKKIDFVIDFLSEDKTNYKQFFKKPKKGTTLLPPSEKSNTSTVTLPDDLHYDITLLTKLFLKPHKSIRHRRAFNSNKVESDEEDEEEKNYDFGIDNINDDDDENDNYYENDINDNTEITNNISSQISSSQRNNFDYIDEPDKVQKLQINFAKRPTKIDVENLKENIWKELCVNKKTKKIENNLQAPKKFSQILQDVPARTPANQVSDISVPLCFICLLELANKKGLQIDQNQNELVITKYNKINN